MPGDQPAVHASTTAPSLRPPSLPRRARASPDATVAAARAAAPMPSPRLPPPRRDHDRGRWSGVLGRIEVGDPGVRQGTLRLRRRPVHGQGATPGGASGLARGRAGPRPAGPATAEQRVYTYDTNRDAWAFYDQYAVGPGDRLWMYLQTEQRRPTARLAGLALVGRPVEPAHQPGRSRSTGQAEIEQYVEVHAENPVPRAVACRSTTCSSRTARPAH